jgi:Na+/melibiose symporter-like transporter
MVVTRQPEPQMAIDTLTDAQVRRNLLLGVANGMLSRFSHDLVDPGLVLTWFVSGLGASPSVIGLLLPISRGVGLVAQLAAAGTIQRLPRKIVAYRLMTVLRASFWVMLVALVFFLGESNPNLLLPSFLLVYWMLSMLRGASALVFMDVVGKAVPAARRGMFFGWRMFSSGLLAFAGSFVVAYVLSDRSGISFPLNFGWLFALAGLAGTMGNICFSAMTEPSMPARSDAVVGYHRWRHMWAILPRNPNFARFLLTVLALLLSTVALPFYTVFAKDELGASNAMAGIYLGVFTAGLVGSTLLWGWLSDRRGRRVILRLACLLSLPVPLCTLLLGNHISYQAFAVAFLLMGVERGAFEMAYLGFVLDVAPEAERVLYVAVANTVMAVAYLLQATGGIVAEGWGLRALFAVSAAAALLSVLLVRMVHEPRTNPGA